MNKINNSIRVGIVSSYNDEKKLARIIFPDLGITSVECQILESCTTPLKVDEYVTVIYTDSKDGYIIGRII